MENNILTVGYHKGEMDFGVNSSIRDLSYEQMKELRQMICVAIGVAESMWRETNSAKALVQVSQNHLISVEELGN